MDLRYINSIFKETLLKRNSVFSSIGFLSITELSNMLVFIKDEEYLSDLYQNTNVSAVITKEEYSKKVLDNTDCGVLVAENPEKVFYLIHNYLYRETTFYKKNEFKTIIGSNANISPKAYIAEKNVAIGDDVIIEPGAIIMEGVSIGNKCVIGANTVIGSRGFQYYRECDSAIYIEHIGGVIIKDNVEILSGSCVASGLISPTCLCDNTKVDNQVQIGHSVYLDKRVLVAAGVVIGGSVYIGKRAWLGMNSVINTSVHIGDDAFVCMGAVVTKDVANNQKVSGNFAIDHKKQIEILKGFVNERG